MHKKIISFSLALILSFINYAYSEGEKQQAPEHTIKPIAVELSDEAAFIVGDTRMTLGEAIHLVLENNQDIITGRYEVAMSNTDYEKYITRYDSSLDIDTSIKYSEYPPDMGPLTGQDQKTYSLSGAISKKIQSGTKISAGLAHERNDKTLYPSSSEVSSFIDAYYNHSYLFLNIQQDLLQNAFGYNEKKQQQILKNIGSMKKEKIIYQLSGLVVEVIVDYWNVVISRSELENSELELRETKYLRDIIADNVSLGLYEKFTLNYYNALTASAEAYLARDKQKHHENVRNLLRTLNMEEGTLSSVAILSCKLPEIKREETITKAFNNRADYQNALLKMENAQLEHQINKNKLLPKLSGEINISSTGQRDEFSDSYSDLSSFSSPAWATYLKISFPWGNREEKIEERNARYKLKQAEYQLNKKKREVNDDVLTKIEHIENYHFLYQKAQLARKEAETYYTSILAYLRKGRFSAADVKNALDAMIESRQKELEILVLYNIALLELTVAKNELFEKYNINIEKYIPKK